MSALGKLRDKVTVVAARYKNSTKAHGCTFHHMSAGREIFVGISSRTNMLGAQAVARAFPEYSTTIVKVHPPAVHLRDYINAVQPEVLIVSKSPAAQKTFQVHQY